MNTIEISVIAPIFLEISYPIADVTDFGNIESKISLFIPKILHKTTPIITPTPIPTKHPSNIGRKYFFIISKFLYSGTASTTVAGATKKVNISAPCL